MTVKQLMLLPSLLASMFGCFVELPIDRCMSQLYLFAPHFLPHLIGADFLTDHRYFFGKKMEGKKMRTNSLNRASDRDGKEWHLLHAGTVAAGSGLNESDIVYGASAGGVPGSGKWCVSVTSLGIEGGVKIATRPVACCWT